MTKSNRSNVADLMRRQAPADLTRAGDMPMLAAAPDATPTPMRKAIGPAMEPANHRVKLSLTASQEAALREKAGDVPLARWIVLHLERQGIIPTPRRARKTLL